MSGLPLSRDPLIASSRTLLVFQVPGIDEAKIGLPISSPNPHSCASRMRNSFSRKGVLRSNYDIAEAVSCYPCYPGKLRSG